jgi:hypothetical protein
MPLLTKRDFELAEKNGIGYHTLKTRVYANGWDVEEAIVKPIKKKLSPWATWKEVATQTGISSSVFYGRINRGWTAEDAAAVPLVPQGQYRRGR